MMMSSTAQIEEVERQRRRLVEQHHRVLKAVATLVHSAGRQDVCKRCRAMVYWITHRNGRPSPYNVDGTRHLANCQTSKPLNKVKEIPTV
jgi:hypothetical protein